MYREPISRPEPIGLIESGFPNNDLMLPQGRTELARSVSEFVFYTEQLSTPQSLRPIQINCQKL